jgi:cyanophycinase
MRLISAFQLVLLGVATTMAQDSRNVGHLVIIGGGLRPENSQVFRRLVDYAGGIDRARFVVLPTASSSDRGAVEFCKSLQRYGIPPAHAEVLDVMEGNANVATEDPENLAKIRAATAVFMAGGDQRRLVRSLTRNDGSDTSMLSEMRSLLARGGLIAGTSAGASAQSDVMLAVSGLPDGLIDEGLDALDFGCTSDIARRGLLVTKGLGFFTHGIIDQHFYQFRGRLGRLARAVSDRDIPYGFGIDENNALVATPDGPLEVVGAGFVTIVDGGGSKGADGPLGYQINDVKISVLSDGDRFDPQTKRVAVASEKPRLLSEEAEYDGNFLLNDIGAGGAVPFALIEGIAENKRASLEGLCFRFHGETSHGYHFKFRKVPATEIYSGVRDQVWLYSLLDLRLDISPIANGPKPSATQIPVDLPIGAIGNAISAVAFRGLMSTNAKLQFRPSAAITRLEFAQTLAQSAHLMDGFPTLQEIRDVDEQDAERTAIHRVVVAGLMRVDDQAKFHPAAILSPQDAAVGLGGLAKLHSTIIPPDLAQQLADLSKLEREVPRATIAVLLHRIFQLP